MTARKAFEAAVTPEEIAAFDGNPGVQNLLRGAYAHPLSLGERESTDFSRAVVDYLLGYLRIHGDFPLPALLEARLPNVVDTKNIVGFYLCDQKADLNLANTMVEGILSHAASLPPAGAEALIDKVIDVVLAFSLNSGLMPKTPRGIAKFIKLEELTGIVKKNMLADLAARRAAPKAGAAPASQMG